MTTIETRLGNVQFDKGSVVMNEETVISLFKLAVALKKNIHGFRELQYIRFGTNERTKICNWIWCLLFEWAVRQDQQPFEFIVRRSNNVSPETSWWYSMAILKHKSSGVEFSIPLPLLGRVALTELGRATKWLEKAPLRVEQPDDNLDESEADYVLHRLSYSKVGPEWAIENPYLNFPNFTPNHLNCWPLPSGEEGQRALGLIAWKYSWSKYRATSQDRGDWQTDLHQWQTATDEWNAQQDYLRGCDVTG